MLTKRASSVPAVVPFDERHATSVIHVGCGAPKQSLGTKGGHTDRSLVQPVVSHCTLLRVLAIVTTVALLLTALIARHPVPQQSADHNPLEALYVSLSQVSNRSSLSCAPFENSSSVIFPSVTHCHHGAGDLVSRVLMEQGQWPDCVTALKLANLSRNLRPAPHFSVLEVGANVGSCTALFLAAGMTDIVVVEPVTGNLNALVQTMIVNGYDKERSGVHAFLAAVSTAEDAEQRPTRTIYVDESNRGGSMLVGPQAEATFQKALAEKLPVTSNATGMHSELTRVTTLDRIIAFSVARRPLSQSPPLHIGLLKMDCQGCEGSALRGGESTLFGKDHNTADIIMFEVDAKLALTAEGVPLSDMLRDLILAHKYNVFYLKEVERVIGNVLVDDNTLDEQVIEHGDVVFRDGKAHVVPRKVTRRRATFHRANVTQLIVEPTRLLDDDVDRFVDESASRAIEAFAVSDAMTGAAGGIESLVAMLRSMFVAASPLTKK